MWIAKRFTIICLFAALVGILIADLIQNSGRSAYALKVQHALPCVFDEPSSCQPPISIDQSASRKETESPNQ
ncbi:MAG: hypothetical protein AAGI92_06905 [Pseudomonadota bacterium]